MSEDWHQVEAARWVQIRQDWLKAHRTVSAEAIARLAGCPVADAPSLLEEWQAVHRVFAIGEGPERLYPLFQFQADGQPRPEFQPLLTALRGRMEGWQLATWLTRPCAEFPNWETPEAMIGQDPQAVIRAAERELGELPY